jgi:Fe-coproporphyrin III synthase
LRLKVEFKKFQKALQALKHPGINTSFPRLLKNALPYYFSSDWDVPPPVTIYWSINSVCDLHCKMCDVGTFNEEGTFYKTLRIDRQLHEIDINVFKRVVDEVATAKPYMSINSTEPMLYKPLVEAVQYCTDRDIEVGVTTGAYQLPKIAEKLAEARLTRLNISIDGPEDIHNHIRGQEDSFQNSIEGLQMFHQRAKSIGYSPEIYLNYTISNLNHHALVDFYDSVKDLPINQCNFTYMWFISPDIAEAHNKEYGDIYPITSSCYNEHTNPHKVEIKVMFEQIQSLKGKPKVAFLPEFSEEKLERFFHNPNSFMEKNAHCMASWFFLQILADGKAVVHTRCHLEPIGNINTDTFYSLWNGKKMKEWRALISRVKNMPMCKRCDQVY